MKEKIQLCNDNVYEIDGISVSADNLLSINFDNNVDVESLINDTSIFNTIRILTRNDEICGVYTGFNTVYKVCDSTSIILSNDGAIYSEPTFTPEEETVPYTPTTDEIRSIKINELSETCEDNIIDGVEIEISGVMEKFSYKLEDQNEISELFDFATSTGLSVPYHCNNGSCKLYAPEEIINLYAALQRNRAHHKTYFNQMKMYIYTLDDVDTISNIEYGQKLTGQYMENYNAIMAQSELTVRSLIDKRRRDK